MRASLLVAQRDDAPWTPPLLVPLVVVGIACLTALTVAAELPGAPTLRIVLDVTTGVVACVLVPALLRWPAAVATLLAVLAAVSPAATPAATLGTLHTARERPLGQAGLVALAGTVGHLVRGAWRPLSGLETGWWVLLVVVAHAALLGWGALARARSDLLTYLWERARRAEQEQASRVQEARVAERTRIAREMHDVLAHRLSLLVTTAGALEYRPDADPARLAGAAAAVRTEAHRALDDLRGVVEVLRYEDLVPGSDGEPVRGEARAGAPQPVLADVTGLVAELRGAGLEIELEQGVTRPEDVPATPSRTVYRIVQEGLTNARRHAPDQPVSVRVVGDRDAGLTVDVVNPLPPEVQSAAGSSTGLIGLTERVELAGGRVRHGATARGFVLHAWLPWRA